MNTTDLAKLAVGITLGNYTANEVSDCCAGDTDTITQVLDMVTRLGAGSIAVEMTDSLLTNTTVGRTVSDTGDSIIDTTLDVVESMNPFNW